MAKEDLEKLLIEKAREINELINEEIPEDGYFTISCWKKGTVLASINYPWVVGKAPVVTAYDA